MIYRPNLTILAALIASVALGTAAVISLVGIAEGKDAPSNSNERLEEAVRSLEPLASKRWPDEFTGLG